jgi:hypothetical protein
MASIINALTASGGGVAISGDATGNLALQTAGNTAVTIDTSQNVGIGTASPSAPLDIQSNSGGTGIRVRGRASANAGAIRYFANDNTTQRARIESNDTSLEINSISSLPITILTADTERMRIASTGLVSTTGSILSGGYVAGAGYYRSSGMVNETVTVTTAATVYGINKDSGAGGSSSTSTYDITGVPNQDGAFFFLYVRCSNTAAGINTVVIVTVHGSAELFRNSVQNTTKTGSVMLARQNGSWYVVAPYHTGAAISI